MKRKSIETLIRESESVKDDIPFYASDFEALKERNTEKRGSFESVDSLGMVFDAVKVGFVLGLNSKTAKA